MNIQGITAKFLWSTAISVVIKVKFTFLELYKPFMIHTASNQTISVDFIKLEKNHAVSHTSFVFRHLSFFFLQRINEHWMQNTQNWFSTPFLSLFFFKKKMLRTFTHTLDRWWLSLQRGRCNFPKTFPSWMYYYNVLSPENYHQLNNIGQI